MAYDDSEDPEDLLTYFDFEPLQEITPATTTSDETELVLENGIRLGHRQNVRFFRQRLRKNVSSFLLFIYLFWENGDNICDFRTHFNMIMMMMIIIFLFQREEGDESVNASKRLEEAEAYAREQGLTRKERRHLLAITDGRKGAGQQDKTNTFEGIKEAAIRRDFRHDLGVRNNLNTTLRLRNQVPIQTHTQMAMFIMHTHI